MLILTGGCSTPSKKEAPVPGKPVEEALAKPSMEALMVNTQEEEQLPLAPDFTLRDLQMKPVSLSAYRNKQPVLLLFWTSWCPFCVKELNKLNAKYKSLADQGIEVLTINAGEPAYKVNAFVKGKGFNFKILLDEHAAVAGSYGVLGVPAFILVDKNGRIIFTDYYFSDKKIEELLSK